MIELKGIHKTYKTGSFEQVAIDDVSISFRECEFVAILGPSGSGKTTLLNILGGLDHGDSGDIFINGVSTHEYRSSDWDTYRNHRIGFIFQSYNLIPHQTVLSNVELALTLAGVDRAERKERATAALEEVGLGEHIDKKPSQLSGGQMQRVAIARALVNDPDIVLADEPTGALDTETGLAVMDLLSKIARDRLVIMVTHNPELAEKYATRIVRLSDGRITEDSDPYVPEEEPEAEAAVAAAAVAEPETEAETSAESETPTEKLEPVVTAAAAAGTAAEAEAVAAEPEAEAATGAVAEEATAGDEPSKSKGSKRHASMSFLTALSLSFNNLMTKKGRTFMTAFAGSIGIIGIAAILALSNGVNNYIAKVEQDTLASYPLTITKSSYDMSSLLTDNSSITGSDDTNTASTDAGDGSTATTELGTTSIPENTVLSDMFAEIKSNDLSAFKSYLEGEGSYINDYVNTIKYDYGITPQIYKSDTTNGVVQLNPGVVESSMNISSTMSSYVATGSFNEMINDQDLLDTQYDVVDGKWPTSYDECVLVLGPSGMITDYTLYNMGVLDPKELKSLYESAMKSEEVDVPDTDVTFTYDDALNMTFKVIPSCNLYRYNSDYNTWTDMSDDSTYMTDKVNNGTTLKIVGVVRPKSTTSSYALTPGIAYSPDLTSHLMESAASSEIVQQQLANPDVDVFTGQTFDELQNENENSLDLSKYFSIDEDAIANAFSIDTSAFDTSGLDIDTSSLAGDMDFSTIAANMPMPDFSSINVNLTSSQQSAIAAINANIIGGFLPYWFANHPGESITATTDFTADLTSYLQTSTVQTEITQIATIMGQGTQDAIQSAMQSYMTNSLAPYMQSVMQNMVQEMSTAMSQAVASSMSSMSSNMGNAISVDGNAFANAIQFNMTQEDLTSLLTNYMNADELTYDGNLSKLGYAEKDNPMSISIYPTDFENKDKVLAGIDTYNSEMKALGEDDKVISYTDIMGELIKSVTRIVNMISQVLIAFVSISLVVSSIMIGIITYISVLERKKEIGILRAMGASKGNIANVFNAETIIEGLIAGVFAILVVLLASIPVNMIVLGIYNVENIMSLPWTSALILIGISVLLTFIAGLIPASAASRRDPVEALRSE